MIITLDLISMSLDAARGTRSCGPKRGWCLHWRVRGAWRAGARSTS